MEVVGERWTMLIVRELLIGPKRYKDLLDALPGIGTNLLAERLKELARLEVIQKRLLPPPAASTVYELTPSGEELRAVVKALEKWGLPFLGLPREDDFYRPAWALLAMECTFRPQLATNLSATYEFRIAEEIFHLEVGDGRCRAHQGVAHQPDMIIELDTKTLLGLGSRRITPHDALSSGKVRIIRGNPEEFERLVAIFELPLQPEEKVEQQRRGRGGKKAISAESVAKAAKPEAASG